LIPWRGFAISAFSWILVLLKDFYENGNKRCCDSLSWRGPTFVVQTHSRWYNVSVRLYNCRVLRSSEWPRVAVYIYIYTCTFADRLFRAPIEKSSRQTSLIEEVSRDEKRSVFQLYIGPSLVSISWTFVRRFFFPRVVCGLLHILSTERIIVRREFNKQRSNGHSSYFT